MGSLMNLVFLMWGGLKVESGLVWANTPLGGQIALGTFLGIAIGFAVKKSKRFLLVVIGLLTLFLLLLQHFGFVTISWEAIEGAFDDLVSNWGGLSGLWDTLVSWVSNSIPVAGSAAVGFLIGFRFLRSR